MVEAKGEEFFFHKSGIKIGEKLAWAGDKITFKVGEPRNPEQSQHPGKTKRIAVDIAGGTYPEADVNTMLQGRVISMSKTRKTGWIQCVVWDEGKQREVGKEKYFFVAQDFTSVQQKQHEWIREGAMLNFTPRTNLKVGRELLYNVRTAHHITFSNETTSTRPDIAGSPQIGQGIMEQMRGGIREMIQEAVKEVMNVVVAEAVM